MDAGDRKKALECALAAARHAGREIHLPRLEVGLTAVEVGKKGVRDLVTEADRLAEQAVVLLIRDSFPDHAIVAEEEVSEEAAAGGYSWYIDPLDGTTNFVHGLPVFCVSIACYGPDGGEVGVVYAPALGECFFASRGEGAFLERERIGERAPKPAVRLSVSATTELLDATLATGFHYDMERNPNADMWARMLPRTRALRRFGSAALDLAYVAAGRFDGFWETGLNPFDLAAGCLLIQEAGGRVSDLALGDRWLEGRSLLATNGALHDPLADEVRAERGVAGILPRGLPPRGAEP